MSELRRLCPDEQTQGELEHGRQTQRISAAISPNIAPARAKKPKPKLLTRAEAVGFPSLPRAARAVGRGEANRQAHRRSLEGRVCPSRQGIIKEGKEKP